MVMEDGKVDQKNEDFKLVTLVYFEELSDGFEICSTSQVLTWAGESEDLY